MTRFSGSSWCGLWQHSHLVTGYKIYASLELVLDSVVVRPRSVGSRTRDGPWSLPPWRIGVIWLEGYPWSRKRAPSTALRFMAAQYMKSSSGPPSHSPRRAASCTRHGLTSRPVNRTCQGVGTGARWVDRGTGAAGPAWLVVREPRGRPAEAIPRTTRPRSRTRRRPRALFWVGGSFLNKVPLTKNSDQANRPIQVDRRPAPDCIPPGRRGGDGYPSPETRTVDPSCLLCCTRTARLRGGSGHTGVRWPVLGLLVHMWLARRTVNRQFSALLRCVTPQLGLPELCRARNWCRTCCVCADECRSWC